MTEPIVTAQTEALIAEFVRSGLRELHVRSGDLEIHLSNDASSASRAIQQQALPASSSSAAAAATSAPAASAPPRAKPAADLPPGAIIVRAPNIGTFYGAPKPGAAAYVSVGSTIAIGAELCLIEVMKLFTAVRAEVAGRIAAILATDGEMVEAGQPLFAIVND